MRSRAMRLDRAAAGVGLLVVALVALAGYRAWSGGRPERLEVLGAPPPFALTDHLGRPVRSDDLRGRVVVADFVFTSCRDVCPTLSRRMAALQERLRRDGLLGARVQLLSFTVDPARDTPAVLRAYAERYHADSSAWRFVTGPEGDVVPLVVQGFRLAVQPVPPPEGGGAAHGDVVHGDVVHSSRFVLLDREGRIRAYYDGLELDLDRVVRDMRQLLG